jgi:cytoskeletal protein CcmA (bactofilin family)
MAQYGEVRIDFITYTTGVAPNEANRTVTVSSLIGNPTFTGDVIISGNLEVADDVYISGNTFISGNLNASGDTTLDDLIVTGIAQIDELFVSGNATITGSTTIESDLTVEQLAYVSGLIVSGNATVSGNLGVSGNIDIGGDVTLESGLEVNGTISGTSGIFGDVDANRIRVSGLEVNALWVSGNTNISGDLSIGDAIEVTGLGTFSGVTVTGVINVSGNANISGDLTASNLHVTGLISGDTDGGVYGSGYWKVPSGTSAQRPASGVSLAGMLRYNTDLDTYEGHDGTTWGPIGGGATGSGGDRVFVLNETGVTTDYTLSGFNASSAGPITIEDGIDVIIADNFNWAIV